MDTFNQGGGNPTKSFQSPPTTSLKPVTKSNPKFFVPVPSSQQSNSFHGNNTQQKTTSVDEINDSPPFQTPTYQSMQRFGSMDDLGKGGMGMPVFPSNTCSRRTVSWGGSMDQRFCNQRNRGNNGDGFMSEDLHEVQL